MHRVQMHVFLDSGVFPRVQIHRSIRNVFHMKEILLFLSATVRAKEESGKKQSEKEASEHGLASLMAVVTSRRSVRVTTDALMMRIRTGLWMAILSTRENDVVGRVDMAIRALRAVVRQTEPSVVERGAQPVVHVVARQARLRIIQCYVIRNARASQ